jgi:hypothetical protein
MKERRITLTELIGVLKQWSITKYVVAVIDNASPEGVNFPVIAENFMWIPKVAGISNQRKDLERLFHSYGIQVENNQPIAVFHHHDLKQSYMATNENVEFYEFSHVFSIAYMAFENGDAKMLSHMLSGTFRSSQVIIVKEGLSSQAVKNLQRQHWALAKIDCNYKDTSISDEEYLIYRIAQNLSGGVIIPDPRRYRSEAHDEIVKRGIAVDQYAIPALFQSVAIQTGTKLDKEFSDFISKREERWQKEIIDLKKKSEEKVAKQRQEKELRQKGELLAKDAVDYISATAPSLGCDHTYSPIYPSKRRDIAAIRRLVENGSSYGYDIIYLVWTDGKEIHSKKLVDSSETKDYLDITKVEETPNGINIEVQSSGSYSGAKWKKLISVPFEEIFSSNVEESPMKSTGHVLKPNDIPPEAKPFLDAFQKEVARFNLVRAGKFVDNKKFQKEIDQLKRKFSNLNNLVYLSHIIEEYPQELVQETLKFFNYVKNQYIVDTALHILGEMALLGNSPLLFQRLLNLLQSVDEKKQEQILMDDNLEYQDDELIEQTLECYEKELEKRK